MNQLRDRFINFLNSRPYLVAAIACFLSLLMVFAQPGYRAFKKMRSQALLAESKQLVEEESYSQAFYKARTAVLLNAANLEAGRHLAELALRFNHPQAHRFWETVIRNEKVEPTDWSFAVDASFRKGDYATAFDYLLRWENDGIETPADFELRRSQAYALAGRLDTAMERADQAIEAYPEDNDIHQLHLYLFNMLASSEQRDQRAQTLVKTSSPLLDDLKWVATNPLVDKPIRIEAIEQILERKDLELAQRLTTINLGAQVGWTEAHARVDAIGLQIDRDDLDQLASYTSALCLLQRYDDVLTLLDEEIAKKDRILMRNLLLAQVKQGGIENALDITSQYRSERLTTLAEETLLRALAFQESGNQGLYQNNLDQAIDSAIFEDLAFLEYQFKQLGETGFLLDLYEEVSKHPVYGSQARVYWLNLALAVRSESEIAYAINDDPSWLEQLIDPQQKANAIYFSLLYATDQRTARHHAEQLAASFNSSASFQLLAAFAYHRAGLYEEARQFLATLPLQSQSLDQRSRYIASVVFQKRNMDTFENLLPAEKALLQ